jgi:hypothetical protein
MITYHCAHKHKYIHTHTRSLAHTLTHTLTHAHAHAHTQTENGEYDGDARAKHIAVQRVCGEFYEYILPFSVFMVAYMGLRSILDLEIYFFGVTIFFVLVIFTQFFFFLSVVLYSNSGQSDCGSPRICRPNANKTYDCRAHRDIY